MSHDVRMLLTVQTTDIHPNNAEQCSVLNRMDLLYRIIVIDILIDIWIDIWI